jgi:predicted transcriptional regulator
MRSSVVGALEAGAREADDGDLHPHEEAVAILEAFGEGNG